MEGFTAREKLIDKYLGEGRLQDAVVVVKELIADLVREKSFDKAEELRERLMDIDPESLLEAVRLADLIEEARSKAVDHDHMDIFKELYTGLDQDEANTLHFAMKEETFGPDATVFAQDDNDDRLILVDSGDLKIIFRHEKDEFLIRNISSGEIAGDDVFLSNVAFCTHSLISLTSVKLHTLSNQVMPAWEKDRPKVAARVKDFCRKFVSVHEIMKKQGRDRRVNKRIEHTVKGMIQLLNAKGGPAAKPMRVTLADISTGGLAFYLKITKQETAVMLLGRNLAIKFPVPIGNPNQEITKKGVVVGVRNHGFGDHSVHVKFEKSVSDKLVDTVEKVSKKRRR